VTDDDPLERLAAALEAVPPEAPDARAQARARLEHLLTTPVLHGEQPVAGLRDRTPVRAGREQHPGGRPGLERPASRRLRAALIVLFVTTAAGTGVGLLVSASPSPPHGPSVAGHSSVPSTASTTTTTARGRGPTPSTHRVFDGVIIVEAPPVGYQPRVSEKDVLARYTGPGTLAAGASSVTVLLGTVTDSEYTRAGRPIIDHRVAWVLYAVGVEEILYGCGQAATTPAACPSSARARLVEIVSPLTGGVIDDLEY
jgi:hypothetical protein